MTSLVENKPHTKDRKIMVDWRLRKMKKLSEDLRSEMERTGLSEESLAKDDRYIRVNMEGVRLVSLRDESALCGLGGASQSPQDAVSLVNSGNEKQPSVFVKPEDKPERRMQAAIIKSALSNGRSMLSLLECLRGQFDELLFALDEVSFGGKRLNTPSELSKRPSTVRIDILAVGKRGGEVFPVVIELKAGKTGRQLHRLVDQLKNAETEIGEEWNNVSSLLGVVTNTTISSTRVRKILIWPSPKGRGQRPRTDVKLTDDKDLVCVEYANGEGDWSNSQKYCVRKAAGA